MATIELDEHELRVLSRALREASFYFWDKAQEAVTETAKRRWKERQQETEQLAWDIKVQLTKDTEE